MRIKHDRRVQTLFGAATIFIVLGTGNLYFGQSKLSHYQELLSAATNELTTTQDTENTDPVMPAINVDQQTQFIKRLQARVDFYTLATLGGRCFLAIAGLCLLGILLIRSIGGDDAGLIADVRDEHR